MTRALLLVLLATLVSCSGQQGRTTMELSSHRDPASFHRSMAYALLRTGQYGRAIPHISRLQEKKKKKSAEPSYLMARALLGMDLLAQARSEIDKALAIDPKYAPAHSLFGLLLDRQGDRRLAEREHRRAIELDAKSAAHHNNLGFCLYLQGRSLDAIAAYRQALALNPTARRVHNNLAFAYAKSGDLAQARKHFTIAGDPAQVNNNMGLVYESMGQLDKAYDLYLQAASAEADPAQARENLTRVCERLGRPLPKLEASKAPPTGSTMP